MHHFKNFTPVIQAVFVQDAAAAIFTSRAARV
jgi:hypothetical protein